jgi:hypothetical protein
VGIEALEPNADLEELLRVVRTFADRDALAAKRAFVFGAETGVAFVRKALRDSGMRLIEEDFGALDLTSERMTLIGNRLAEME